MIDLILSTYPKQFRKSRLPKNVIEEAKARVLDSIGCFYGAFQLPQVKRLRQTLSADVIGPTTLWGTNKKVAPEHAAWANGTAIRALDFNDTYLSKEPCHPSDLLAAIWAACELSGQSRQGERLLRGMILGYEVLCRLCDAMSIRLKGWDHVTYLPIASAVACSYIFNLSPEKTRHAIALATTGNNALRQTRVGTISDWKAACAAYASQAGLWAARLAHAGFTGPSDVFSGRHGFFKQISGPFTLSPRLGSDWMMMKTHVKYYPAEHHSQSAIEAALDLRTRLKGKRIKKIVIETFDVAVDIIGHEKEKWQPTTRETADHSLPYLVAVALLDGDVNLNQYSHKRYLKPDIRRLLKLISVQRSERLDRLYPLKMPTRVRVITTDNKEYSEEVLLPRGYAGRPMTRDEVETKFTRLTKPHLSQKEIQKWIQRIYHLEKLPHLKNLWSKANAL